MKCESECARVWMWRGDGERQKRRKRRTDWRRGARLTSLPSLIFVLSVHQAPVCLPSCDKTKTYCSWAKSQVFESEGIPDHELRFAYGGKQLDHDQDISSVMPDCATVNVELYSPPPPPPFPVCNVQSLALALPFPLFLSLLSSSLTFITKKLDSLPSPRNPALSPSQPSTSSPPPAPPPAPLLPSIPEPFSSPKKHRVGACM